MNFDTAYHWTGKPQRPIDMFRVSGRHWHRLYTTRWHARCRDAAAYAIKMGDGTEDQIRARFRRDT